MIVPTPAGIWWSLLTSKYMAQTTAGQNQSMVDCGVIDRVGVGVDDGHGW